jgi:hypothetical protein
MSISVARLRADERMAKSITMSLRSVSRAFPGRMSASVGTRVNARLHVSWSAAEPPTQWATVQCSQGTYHIELQTGIERLTRQRIRTTDGKTRGAQRLMQSGPSF